MTALIVYGLTLVVHQSFQRPALTISKQDSSLNFNHDFLRIFSVGNKKLLSDIIWVQTLLESDTEHYKQSNFNNWMYLRFMTIAALDPLFYENYFYGALYLSIVKDDVKAAAVLYDKGLEKYPDDYDLTYNAGFNYYFEMGDYERGLKLLRRIKDHPKTPEPTKSVIHKLELATGTDIHHVFQLVLQRFDKTIEPVLRDKLSSDLYAIKAEIDLQCLNQNGQDCDRLDFEKVPYVKGANGIWKTVKPFALYRLKKKRSLSN